MAVIRFLQVSDLHLGRPFGWLPPERRADRRSDQRRALDLAVRQAIERGVARHPRAGRPLRPRLRGRRDARLRGARLRRDRLPAGVHRPRQPRPVLARQRPLEPGVAQGARLHLARPRVRLQPAGLDARAALGRGRRDPLGALLDPGRGLGGPSARARVAGAADRDRRQRRQRRALPRLARGLPAAGRGPGRALLRRRGAGLALRLPRRGPRPRAAPARRPGDRRAPRQRRRRHRPRRERERPPRRARGAADDRPVRLRAARASRPSSSSWTAAASST